MIWGSCWQGKVVHVHSDNEAVVSVLNMGYSKDEQMMHLVRCLFFILAVWDISLFACHLPGVLNVAADAISRDNLPLLFFKVPDVSRQATPLPQALVDLLVAVQPDWTSRSWSHVFKNCLQLA